MIHHQKINNIIKFLISNTINTDAFMLYQHINLAQVRDFQYKFYLEEN